MKTRISRFVILSAIVCICVVGCDKAVGDDSALGPLAFLFGTWTLTGDESCPHICASGDPTGNGYKDRQLHFDPLLASNGDEVCARPVYSFYYVERAEFISGWRVEPETLGLDSNRVLMVDITCDGPYSKEWVALGASLLVRDSQTILTHFNGLFYEAKRSDRPDTASL